MVAYTLVAGRLTELSTSKLGVVLSTETAGNMPPAALDTSWSAVFASLVGVLSPPCLIVLLA
jgi:hypothetical protein